MNYTDLQSYFHHHCKIKLRSGKEVFGVLWEEMTETDRAIYFASYIEHKRHIDEPPVLSKENSAKIALEIEDILGVEPVREH